MAEPWVQTYVKTDATVQRPLRLPPRGERFPVNSRALMMAEAEYERQYGTSQTIDRLRERGGLGLTEMIALLACAVERYAPPEALVPRTLTREDDRG